MKKNVFAMLMMVSLMFVSGCAEMNRFSNWFNTNEDSLKTTVYITTDAILRNKPADALKVTQILVKVRDQIKAGTLTTASNVKAYIDNEISHASSNPADLIILNILTDDLQKRIIDTLTVLNLKTPAEQLVEVDTILGWVLDISSKIK
jgi:hypothetical protein